MQGKTDAPQQMQTLIQLGTFGFGEKTKTDHLIQRGGAEMAAGHPLQGMDIAQAAGAAFDIRLQVIAGAVVALVAHLLLIDLGGEELLRGPEAVAEDVLLQLKEQGHVANQQARFNQVGGDGEIG
ncbi:hypothetical protein D3C76_1176270 [compost metagenome]